jgi:hypothetical protein
MIDDEPAEKKSEKKAETIKPEPEEKKEQELIFPDGTAVAAPGLGIHLIVEGKRRWVPDTWTQTKLHITMDEVVMLFPNQLLSIPEGPAIPSRAPEEPLF